MTTTSKERGNRPYRSYEEFERELMPKQAEVVRPIQDPDVLRDRLLEIIRRTFADIARDGAA